MLDTIAAKYVDMLLEMAQNIGKTFSPIENRPGLKSAAFNAYKDLPVAVDISPDVKVHVSYDKDSTKYNTLDHKSKELIHMSHVVHDTSKSRFPFDYNTQDVVDRVKSSALPKGFATNFAYTKLVKEADTPLKSSDTQYDRGNELWGRLVVMAVNDGHHVYHHDESTGETKEITKDNLSDVNSYFGKGDEFQKKHLFISKTPLSFKKET